MTLAVSVRRAISADATITLAAHDGGRLMAADAARVLGEVLMPLAARYLM